MNRILFYEGEVSGDMVSFGGARAEHVLKVLHGEVGQSLKTGVVNGKVGTGEIVAISGGVVTMRVSHSEDAPPPWADLVLAPPRPRALKRLLPQLAAMGVGRIVLVGATKVDKDFWGATLLREGNYTPLLVEGLMQAGTSALPSISSQRNFRRWLRDDLEREFPASFRVVAHPYGEASGARGQSRPGTRDASRLLLAVGPEGGWTDEEVALLESHGFARHSLGPRILRTDTAVIALLAQFMPGAVRHGAPKYAILPEPCCDCSSIG